ncbi:MAG TPA: YfbU family protein [Thermoanaerobaculia bacterium]|nr:YfbU family protein [Thermoanaerobaculia bacterium]
MTDNAPKLTPAERLILANQYRTLSALNKKDADYYNYPSRILILESGLEDHYHEIFGSIAEPPPSEMCANVVDILNLFDAIYESTKCQPPEQLRFEGFDYNTENEALNYAQFLYDRNGGGGFRHIPRPENSHSSVMPSYMRMVKRRKEKTMHFLFSQEHLDDLVNARSMR